MLQVVFCLFLKYTQNLVIIQFMFQSLSLSDSASSSLVPQTGSRIFGQQPQIVQTVQNKVNQSFPLLKQDVDMRQDKGEFQKKLAYLSKASLQLGRKCLYLQEKVVAQEQQMTLLRDRYLAQKAFSQLIVQQKDKLQVTLSLLQSQLRNKESFSQATTLQRENSCRGEYEETVQTQRRHLQQLSSAMQQLQLVNQQQKMQIFALSQKITEIKKELDMRQQACVKAKLSQQQLYGISAQLRSAYQKLSKVVADVQLLRNQKKQLQAQLLELKGSCRSISQIQLAAIQEEEILMLREDCRLKDGQLKKIEDMYRELQQNFEKVRRQRDFLNDNYNSLSQDKSQVEHILIDKFVLALVIMKSKLQSAEVDNLIQCMDLQKKAIFCRLDMEYKKMMG